MNIFFKLLVLIYSLQAFFNRKVLIKGIKKNDLVLDVGSGDKPFWRADVIVDKYLHDNQQRNSGSVILDPKKLFVKADVENLPFKDKVFDFVFCSHLLEHVDKPEKAISEILRVAKAGYIEVPNSVLEIFKPFPPHLWYCLYDNETLIFRQKEKNNDFMIDSVREFGSYFFKNPVFQYLLNKNTNKIFICLYWKEELRYKVLRSSKKNNVYRYKEKDNLNKSLYLKISFTLYKFFYEILVFFFYRKKNIKKIDLFK